MDLCNDIVSLLKEIGKVLYCYPAAISQDRQLKQVGLCEAIIKFAGYEGLFLTSCKEMQFGSELMCQIFV